MKNNVFDIRTRVNLGPTIRNTRIHPITVNKGNIEDSEKFKEFFEYYAKWYECDIEDVRAYMFVFNFKSSHEFVKEQVLQMLPTMQKYTT